MDITEEPARVVFYSPGHHGIQYPQQLTRNYHKCLHFLERIFLSGKVVLIDFLEFRIVPDQGQGRLVQVISQPLSAALTDNGLSIMLSGTVLYQCKTGQFLYRLYAGESADVTDLCMPTIVRIPSPLISSMLST